MSRRPSPPSTAPLDVTPWRRRQLRRAGLDRASADRIARDRRYDLHAVLELVDQGCPATLAIRILAPLDEAPR